MRSSRICFGLNGISGLTLIETMITVAVLAVLASIAVTQYATFISNERLKGVSDNYRTDFQWARSLAVENKQSVYLHFGQSGNDTCYVVYSGSANACVCESQTSTCTGTGTAHRLVRLLGRNGLTLVSKGSQKTILIEPVRGVITPTLTVDVTGSTGQVIRHITNIMGRTRICTPGGAALGFAAC